MLVNCMVYCRGEKLADIALDKLGDYLRLPDHFVWVALRDTHMMNWRFGYVATLATIGCV